MEDFLIFVDSVNDIAKWFIVAYIVKTLCVHRPKFFLIKAFNILKIKYKQ